MSKFEFEPIGYISSVFKSRFGTPRQPLQVSNSKATLKIRRDLQPELALQGLESFSHLWLVFVFHENTNKIFRPKIHPPRLEGQTIGAFATRTPHRPNPIGLSLVKLEKIEGDTLQLSGVDLIEGTPVLDIKPYLKYVESQPEAQEGWLESKPQTNLPVEFYNEFEKDILKLQNLSVTEQAELKKLITEVLEKDPRPQVYKDDPEHKETHAVYLDRWNIFFKFQTDRVFVSKVELA